MIIIGIDPGTNTGIAVKDLQSGKFIMINSFSIIDALIICRDLIDDLEKENVYLIFEDARQRTWFGKAGREKLQGVGSIKRDCSIWQEFCERSLDNWIAKKPEKGTTKIPANIFKAATGWKGRTNEHARDAAMLIHAYNSINIKTVFPKITKNSCPKVCFLKISVLYLCIIN